MGAKLALPRQSTNEGFGHGGTWKRNNPDRVASRRLHAGDVGADQSIRPEPARHAGEEAQAWSGVAKVGNKQEWPAWIPTQGEHERLGPLPARVEGGPQNPMGARGIYLYSGNKDTLFRIHGTNQPEYIGQAISSGCIRMTNEDVIDLYNRVKMGAIVVVLAPKQGDSPYNPRVALAGGRN